ncbi:MAG: bifunctional methionine sulfoxide reductase B/A protein [Brevinematales bacterium]|nr:bifunctional methionine sulfoxide reductase B/A protein [Brevinematales bacterium]
MRKGLSEKQKRVFFGGETEPPFQNEYWDNKHHGLYVDPVSGEVLFSSLDKFDSGTGWPSFSKPVHPELLEYVEDLSHGMRRVEVRTKHTKGHLGHVFHDGPPPTWTRFCINSASLRFIPVEEVVAEGYLAYWYLFSDLSLPFEQIILGGGCFWGVEAYFKEVEGILATTVGYSGGETMWPTYEDVCTGETGHVETVLLRFDPKILPVEKILGHFFFIHDPESENRQGHDVGTQYRSVIFYLSEKHVPAIEKWLEKLRRDGKHPVTHVSPAKNFYPAEEYHQDYIEKNPGGYCHIDLSKRWPG